MGLTTGWTGLPWLLLVSAICIARQMTDHSDEQSQMNRGMRVSNAYPKDAPELVRQQSADQKNSRFKWGLGSVFTVMVIAAAVSGCGSGGKSDKADSAANAPASAGAGASRGAAPTGKGTADAAPTPKAKSTVLTLTGSGTKNTSAFKGGDDWTLSYTFDCTKAMAAVDGKGNFMVFDKNDKLVNEMDKTGKGTTSQHTAGSHQLQIVSECAWTVQVTG
ncbi:hypothetical protein ABZ858_14080 [Streptomyces sp. NPDC047017]|uniref:hypothetical protein n=1 Tax=Streptomyces sp. NPDC047017 TaxID=3155024 RepID=UPI0033D92BA3